MVTWSSLLPVTALPWSRLTATENTSSNTTCSSICHRICIPPLVHIFDWGPVRMWQVNDSNCWRGWYLTTSNNLSHCSWYISWPLIYYLQAAVQSIGLRWSMPEKRLCQTGPHRLWKLTNHVSGMFRGLSPRAHKAAGAYVGPLASFRIVLLNYPSTPLYLFMVWRLIKQRET